MELPSTRFARKPYILLDNPDVVRQLLSVPTFSSQEIFSKFASKAREYSRCAHLPFALLGEVRVHWIPGHSGILDSALPDRAMKETMTMLPPPLSPLTIASAKTWTKISTAAVSKKYWVQHIPQILSRPVNWLRRRLTRRAVAPSATYRSHIRCALWTWRFRIIPCPLQSRLRASNTQLRRTQIALTVPALHADHNPTPRTTQRLTRQN